MVAVTDAAKRGTSLAWKRPFEGGWFSIGVTTAEAQWEAPQGAPTSASYHFPGVRKMVLVLFRPQAKSYGYSRRSNSKCGPSRNARRLSASILARYRAWPSFAVA